MKQVNLRKELVSVLKSALEKRLLNAGVNTDNVLEAYVATVRALKFVDPSGILAQLVTPPVREYLKHREETVRVILVSLTDESGELAEELSKNPTYVDRKSINMSNWKSWEPGMSIKITSYVISFLMNDCSQFNCSHVLNFFRSNGCTQGQI